MPSRDRRIIIVVLDDNTILWGVSELSCIEDFMFFVFNFQVPFTRDLDEVDIQVKQS